MYKYNYYFLFLLNVWPLITDIEMSLLFFLIRKCVYLVFFKGVPWGDYFILIKP